MALIRVGGQKYIYNITTTYRGHINLNNNKLLLHKKTHLHSPKKYAMSKNASL